MLRSDSLEAWQKVEAIEWSFSFLDLLGRLFVLCCTHCVTILPSRLNEKGAYTPKNDAPIKWLYFHFKFDQSSKWVRRSELDYFVHLCAFVSTKLERSFWLKKINSTKLQWAFNCVIELKEVLLYLNNAQRRIRMPNPALTVLRSYLLRSLSYSCPKLFYCI